MPGTAARFRDKNQRTPSTGDFEMSLRNPVLARLTSCGLALVQAWRRSIKGQLILGASLSLWACSTSTPGPQTSAPASAGQPATEQPAAEQPAAEAGASPVGIDAGSLVPDTDPSGTKC